MPHLTQTHRPQLLHRFPFISLSIVMEALFFKQKTRRLQHISVTPCVFLFYHCVTAVLSILRIFVFFCSRLLFLFRRPLFLHLPGCLYLPALFRLNRLNLLCPSVNLRHLPALCNQLRCQIILLHAPAPVLSKGGWLFVRAQFPSPR